MPTARLLVTWLALALPLAFAQSGGDVEQVVLSKDPAAGFRLWMEDRDQDSALSSAQLAAFVPQPKQPTYPWAYDRFGLTHLVTSLYENLWNLRGTNGGEWTKLVAGDELIPADELVNYDDGSAGQLFKLGECFFYGAGTSRNLTRAFAYYQRAADMGSAPAQFMIGLKHSTGVFGNFEVDQAKALVYYSFAAEAGDIRAQMALGFRYYYGVGVARDPSKSAFYYGEAADKAIVYYEDGGGVKGFRYNPRNAWSIADEFGQGIFNFLQSDAKLSPATSVIYFALSGEKDEILEQLEYSALEEDNVRAHFILTQYYHRGGSFNQPRYDLAMAHAHSVLDHYERTSNPSDDEKYMASYCYAYIGDRFRRADGAERDIERAKAYYKKGIGLSEKGKYGFSFSPMGLIELDLAAQAPVDSQEAAHHQAQADKYFKHAADSGEFFGRVLYVIRNSETAEEKIKGLKQLHNQVSKGPLAAYWVAVTWEELQDYFEFYEDEELRAEFQALNFDVDAASLYRRVCQWMEDLHSPMRWAQETYPNDLDSALLGYLVTAEQGYTSSQFNIGDLLDTRHSALPISWLRQWPVPPYVKNREQQALTFFTRAAQNSLDAEMKVADYYYYGIGTERDLQKAFDFYKASWSHARYGPPLALWNMAWMYEFGEGVAQDLHLAKRHYDEALSWDDHSFIMVNLALIRLRAKLFVEWLRYGNVATADDAPENKLTLWQRMKLLRDAPSVEYEWAKDEYVEEEVTVAETIDFASDLYFFGGCFFVMVIAIFFRIRHNRRQLRRQRERPANAPADAPAAVDPPAADPPAEAREAAPEAPEVPHVPAP